MLPKCRSCEYRRFRLQALAPSRHQHHDDASGPRMALSTPDPVQSLLEPVCKFFRKIISPSDETTDRMRTRSVEAVDGEEVVAWSGRTVFVAGGTGRTGRTVVRHLLAKRDKVVALVSSEKRIQEILGDEMKEHGPNGSQLLAPLEGDIKDEEALRRGLEGCDAVVCAVGTRFVPEVGFVDSPEELYAKGVMKLVRVAASLFGEKPINSSREELSLFSFVELGGSSAEGAKGALDSASHDGRILVDGWAQQDDTVGTTGLSESSFALSSDGAVFEGTLSTAGPAFCATGAADIPGGPRNLAPYDGITMTARGDGQRYTMYLKNRTSEGGFDYEASFDTVRGEWVTVDIPFNRFRPGTQADVPPFEPNEVASISLAVSESDSAGMPNYLCNLGKFKLEVKSIQAYRNPRPQFVLVSSAGVERSARAKTPDEREKSIPIVKLNPGGILTWKLIAEDILRASGLKYTIVRPCGLNDEKEDTPYLLEVSQGDAITGLIPRKAVARVCVEALDSPNAAKTTFEVRCDVVSEGLEQKDYQGLFERLRPDLCPRPVLYVQGHAQTPEETPSERESVSEEVEEKVSVQAS
ncbi:hypothetical protein CBR_g23069 [Chara braunii]|uniref:NAD(P)-binding domain-containing protein n=1 Tax=Chara braunii TaxID=69332 RepID=A0A388L3H1_CHABU|nr:hypothetical protein CBR_g23069 [Chara braunii]|eukprot:GBG76854.1 hypothetical protein CBR_g23069 [Chara braunii]